MTNPWTHRLLAGLEGSGSLSAGDHTSVHGALPAGATRKGGDLALIREIDASGLLGRGGAGFPAGRKVRTVAAGKRPVVVANGAEGEPASGKDVLLMTRNPHLVLDGLAVAARAVGAAELHLALHRGSAARATMTAALRERRDLDVTIHELPGRYVASEASAVVHFINGGDAKPMFRYPEVYERGVGGRPTLVHNVETLAHLALIGRHGSEWFRSVGDVDEPGTMLLTVTTPRGATVAETVTGTTVGTVLDAVGHTFATSGAVLIGGYFGTWVSREQAWHLPLTHYALKAIGGGLGAGILVALPADGVCGLAEAARVADYLARENAGQCGPCFNGLPALAGGLTALATKGHVEPAMSRWLSVVPGRGACAHPDGATRMIASALATFAGEADRHATRGPCADAHRPPLLPVPATTTDWR
ncbi:MAG TPA: NADH-ubiquinone oxidoreductase-F iron-sulfur binding region domain-containing protein [Jatrophihabitans sp.]|jgi:NADH:ubiquinone oxidoreductase subunit F (NADH-binding)|uniref:NADH-ubiquinone oxidoreductase-F iron-sulfur binding region domain-containing protein n=1 Tax=Jatrophihabitans sp. TaxID=1932789 RepID=UPI002DFA3586|nr:NADH-ubiquinone oxidoreductase-F iron-sulfur binding region domain-containing protein [Jatrophihabitans sp.]